MDKDHLNLIVASLLILAIGLFSGYSLGFYRGAQSQFPEIRTVAEVNPGIATLRLNGMRDGNLTGKIEGREVRVIVDSQDIRTFAPGSDFEIPLKTAVSNQPAASSVPAEALFVASRRGKLYYSIFDPRALDLSPENRVYFQTAEAAEKDGYQKASTP